MLEFEITPENVDLHRAKSSKFHIPPHRRSGRAWQVLAKLVAASTLPHNMAMSSSRAAAAWDMAKASVSLRLEISRMPLTRGVLAACCAAMAAANRGASQSFIKTPFSVGKAQQQ